MDFWKHRSAISFRRFFYRTTLFLGDVTCLLLSFVAGFHVRFNWEPFLEVFPPFKGVPTPESYLSMEAVGLLLLVASFVQSGLYRRLHVAFADELLRVLRAVAKGWVLILAVTFLYRDVAYSRLAFALSAGFCVVFVMLLRETAKALYRRYALRWWEPHKVLILGRGRMAQSIARVLKKNPEIVPESRPIATADELRAFLAANPVREVFAGEPDLDHVALMTMSDVCDEADVPFKIIPDLLEVRMGEIVFDDSLGLPTFSIRSASLMGGAFLFKRLFDVTVSIICVSLFFVPLAFIAFMVWLDSPGPVFFRQLRMGFRRRPFGFLKFRTMVQNADDLLEELKKKSDRPGPVFKMKNDPRVTRVGQWLRKYSIDEIPQILNVLKGEMSLVGPRPQVLWETEAYDQWARKRLNVLPGITGLWQVSGRARLSYEEMIELDIYYIEHWSPGLDLTLLARTLPTILGGDGAY